MGGAPDGPIAVIPARGGSKRLPRKNVRPFAGRPIIAWSIDAALRSGCFSRIIVSTNDEEITKVASAHGAEVPFRRPAELADDHATTSAVIAHAVRWALGEGLRPSAACCIYATAPFLEPPDIR
jgi:N-acylneuraminate cytidylyltransferase